MFAKTLRNLRVSRKMTQNELAKVIGVSEISVRNWERGVKNPSMEALISLSEAFDVNVDVLLGLERRGENPALSLTDRERTVLRAYRAADERGKSLIETVCRFEERRASRANELSARRKTIPLYLTPSAAGISVPLDGQEYELIDAPERFPQADYAVRIQGRSMEPLIPDEATVFVQKTETLEPGEIGIFAVDGAMYCKRYLPGRNGTLTLASENPALQEQNVMIEADSGQRVQCFGRVLF